MLNLEAKTCTLPMFIKKMSRLKVLLITNDDFFPAEIENFEVLDHLSILKRLRLEKVSISFINTTGVQLKNLQKCSFFMCNVNEALHYPSFRHAAKFGGNELCCTKLSALPEGIGKLVNLKSLRISCCTGLLKLPDSVTKLQSLQFLDISNCISLTELPDDMGKLSNLEKLNVSGCSRLTKLPLSIIYLGSLKNVVCDEEMAGLWEPAKETLSDLRLHVTRADFNLDFVYNLSS